MLGLDRDNGKENGNYYGILGVRHILVILGLYCPLSSGWFWQAIAGVSLGFTTVGHARATRKNGVVCGRDSSAVKVSFFIASNTCQERQEGPTS